MMLKTLNLGAVVKMQSYNTFKMKISSTFELKRSPAYNEHTYCDV